jgi:nucleotide-binding universal stress UspA family protein
LEVPVIFHKILIALDDSPIAAHAVDVGVELGGLLKAEIALVHVVGSPIPVGTDVGISAAEFIDIAKEEGRKLLDGVRQRLSLDTSVQKFLEYGDAAVEIVEAAKSWPADLVVIGSHGRGGLDRAILGSVAESVMRKAPCPVLVIRAAK